MRRAPQIPVTWAWLVLGCSLVASGAPVGDEILSLPGAPDGALFIKHTCAQNSQVFYAIFPRFPARLGWLPGRQYSGYVDVTLPRESTVMHVHYWLVVQEAQGAADETETRRLRR
eukprot:scaffold427_cov263-Pinguiococcus_pyrenoidosus.AAC.20